MFKLSFAIPMPLDEISVADFEKYVSETAKMGYAAVEPLINDPAKVDFEAMNAVLQRYNMKISGLRSGSVYAANGWRLSSPDKANRDAAIKRLNEIVELAGKFETSIMVGLIQGHLGEGETLEQAEQWICEGLAEVNRCAAKHNVTIQFEPVNRFELEYHNTVESIIECLHRINDGVSHPVKLLSDVYHMHLGDPSVPSALIRSMPYMGHVHFADSTRCAPGTGCIDFAEVIKDLVAMDYEGYAAVEVTAIPSILASAQQSIDYLQPIMDANRV